MGSRRGLGAFRRDLEGSLLWFKRDLDELDGVRWVLEAFDEFRGVSDEFRGGLEWVLEGFSGV